MQDTLDSTAGPLTARRWPRLRCRSQTAFALGVSATWLLLYNHRFWHDVLEAMWRPEPGGVVFLVALFTLVLFLQSVVLMVLPGRHLPRAAASALFLVAAASSYFSDSYGVFLDREMMRNVFETDRLEAVSLISPEMLGYFLLLGVLPATLVWRVDLPQVRWQRQLRERAAFIVAGLAICFIGVFASSASYAVFLREHKPVRYLISPGSMVTGAVSYLAEAMRPPVPALTDPGGAVALVGPPNARPLLVFLVIGETARAANFQLEGYQRATNPRLSTVEDLVYFNNTTSCGTSTAVSVPCMFSHLGREHYTKSESARYYNLLDMLDRAGVDVEWRDNNSGCKGVCARVKSVDFTSARSPLCHGGYCYDEIMLSGLKERVRSVDRDTLIVFHQVGSHGPAYSERYPREFEHFTPVCSSNELDRCSREQVVNSYDNSIRYTDHNLAAQIDVLKSVSDRLDTLLIYVSDHGESLGENRTYLHGMPYAFAPAVQKEVPFLIWTSPHYRQRSGLQQSCLQSQAREPLSHDNLFHAVMGAMGVRNEVYRPQLDVLAYCEGTWLTRR